MFLNVCIRISQYIKNEYKKMVLQGLDGGGNLQVIKPFSELWRFMFRHAFSETHNIKDNFSYTTPRNTINQKQTLWKKSEQGIRNKSFEREVVSMIIIALAEGKMEIFNSYHLPVKIFILQCKRWFLKRLKFELCRGFFGDKWFRVLLLFLNFILGISN